MTDQFQSEAYAPYQTGIPVTTQASVTYTSEPNQIPTKVEDPHLYQSDTIELERTNPPNETGPGLETNQDEYLNDPIQNEMDLAQADNEISAPPMHNDINSTPVPVNESNTNPNEINTEQQTPLDEHQTELESSKTENEKELTFNADDVFQKTEENSELELEQANTGLSKVDQNSEGSSESSDQTSPKTNE